ncbi:RES domain-containing protein [Cryptosporangium sp. NPDC048952]|uniref:RES domain-containing protein n=1 Tax=Cryptosporangium sp. NPDC048952 TaxID=3363961 RepID=UPI00371E13D8
MLLYRVIPYLETATAGTPGHPLYVSPHQSSGRLDNPTHYATLYFALEPSGAVGERFGDEVEWTDDTFRPAGVPGSVCSLVTYRLADHVPLLDLDDASNLAARGLRPTQVIERNRSATQGWALRIFSEQNHRGQRLWDGVRWWSFHRPAWRIVGYWGTEPPVCLKAEPLGLGHPAIVDAGQELGRDRPGRTGSYAGPASASSPPKWPKGVHWRPV